MNMTAEENIAEAKDIQQDTATEALPDNYKAFKERLAKMQQDPEFIRMMQNRQRANREFSAIMDMKPEERSALLFAGQTRLMYFWNVAQDKRRKEEERKERAA